MVFNRRRSSIYVLSNAGEVSKAASLAGSSGRRLMRGDE